MSAQFKNIEIIDGIVYPGEYIPYKSVERIFKTAKSFSFFMNRTKEEDIEDEELKNELSILENVEKLEDIIHSSDEENGE